MEGKTDKFRSRRPAGKSGSMPPAPAPPAGPPPLWFGLAAGGFIGVLISTSAAVGMYWLGALEVNLDALRPSAEPTSEATEVQEPVLEATGTSTAFSVIVSTPTPEPTETETPQPTPDWAATATDACGAFMDEFPGTPCPSPFAP